MAENLKERYGQVRALRNGMARGEAGLSLVPRALVYTIESGAWREFIVEETGEVVRYDRFADFVTTQPLEGLGFTVDLLRNLCRDDRKALDALDQETANPNGTNRYSSSLHCNELDKTPQQNTTPGTLRRLRKDAPELHARVLQGELSPSAAAVAAGFRPRQVSVRVDDSASAARTLARAWGDRLGELIAELQAARS